MIFGQDRDELRRMYRDAWRKAQTGEPLSPLQAQIAEVIGDHAEYQSLIENFQTDVEYLPEHGHSNPYLHMGLHLALRDQLKTNRPAGIRPIFAQLAAEIGDRHAVEHAMLECLAESLWEGQQNNAMPDEELYLERLKRLVAR